MTNIEWCDRTSNPIRVATGGHWCQKISPGCANCYSEKLQQNSFFKGSKLAFSGQPPEMHLVESEIETWRKIRKPQRIFTSSTTDIFGAWVKREWQFKIFDAAAASKNATLLLLTKRPAIMSIAASEWMAINGLTQMPDNIWMGTSVENQKTVRDRIPYLAQIPSIRFLSCEPLLEPIRLEGIEHIHWVIIGGESGPNARSFDFEWGKELIDQCRQAPNKPAVFFKQVGSNAYSNGKRRQLSGKGNVFQELPLYLRIREFPRRKKDEKE